MVEAEVIMEEDGRVEDTTIVVEDVVEDEGSTTVGMEEEEEEEADSITVSTRTEVTMHRTAERVTSILQCWRIRGQSLRATAVMEEEVKRTVIIGMFRASQEDPCRSQ